ncbi:MBOAT family protein [Campylobacter hepaticus]|uniref:MBOAT family protein n=1 Tax=Campylobacter hepaticus TaxID=1813019 RepID=A0A6A7JTQ4_9BACT|nr:MBOAT family O-acyltransferase [Campylobacter hepaticus]AXP08793.1 MBOAT family protein [Campylobacter hepaticus]MPV53655.1 MBOAT family protein [Campylobacter hepaticus]MPV61738.1 MBOAT family protein [Campylobacter hepaticus]MPV77213.1 MBOAT family protein [Campylobacter hepaticus]MPV78977.1 MBOAT family protein [Campylobacter hepaticus]
MTYFSLEFSILMIAFFAIYWAFKNSYKIQNILILIFSYIIYILINPYFALVLFIYTFFIHYFALVIFVRKKRYIFITCIAFIVLNLCFFKYFPSLKESFDEMLNFFGLEFLNIDLMLPIGISFYTFSSITYIVEVYKKHRLESFLNLATFLSFFPTLISGPIMRSSFFFEQAFQKREFKHTNLIIILIIFGIVKKVLIANYLGIYAKNILDFPQTYNFIQLLSAIYAYTIQIYCDFSGYIDLVCAFALMLGFKLPLNFNMPYLAKNLKDFWARWHISLSTFIRDYIYIPLGGNKKGLARTISNILIAFTLSGMWHGNTLSFVIWGLLHGFGVVFMHLLALSKFNLQKIPILGRFLTLQFICFTWIFFYYSKNLDDALEYFKACYDNFFNIPSYNDIYMLVAFAILFIIYPLFINFKDYCIKILNLTPFLLKPFIIAFILLLVFAFMPDGIPDFIYSSF